MSSGLQTANSLIAKDISKRNGEIDLFRFIFSVMIIIFHFGNTYNYRIFQNGYIAVEFFFVVSGYLMARHVWLKSADIRDLGAIADETWRYLRKKQLFFTLTM